jgi:hypothetical protein
MIQTPYSRSDRRLHARSESVGLPGLVLCAHPDHEFKFQLASGVCLRANVFLIDMLIFCEVSTSFMQPWFRDLLLRSAC